MKTMTATEFKAKTSEALESAQSEPVSISKNGRPVAVLIRQSDYERLVALENKYWLARVEQAEKSGFIGTDATTEFLKSKLLDAEA